MIPLDEILESLDLSRATPGIGFLSALFARFNARVPFENASKILRDREVADPAAKARTPDVFWADHLELGTGGTCFARVAAFDALLTALGFRTRRLLGRVEDDGDHAALAVATPAGESFADVGFPLPALLPDDAERVETPLAELAIARTARGISVEWIDGVPEGPRSLEIFSATVSEERFAEYWRQTFRPGSRFLSRISLRRDLENRAVSYAGGQVRVDDRHSRLRAPVAQPQEAALAELFGVERDVLERAFAIVGDDRSSSPPPDATLTAYLEVAAAPEVAFAAIASPAGYRQLIGSVAEIVSEAPTSSGFRLVLGAPGRDGAEEAAVDEVSPDLTARRLRLERRTKASTLRSAYAVEERAGRIFLIREATLAGPREDLLRNDSMRGRLAGILALDLLAWARML